MRILVITLHTIENEFDECVESIRRQSYQDFEHLVFHNLSSTEAHEKLYGTFMERADEFELMIKVDADMVLEDAELFDKIVDVMQRRTELDLYSIYCWDNFLDEQISGLHTFRNTVRFETRDPSFPDNHSVVADRSFEDKTSHGRSVIHCKNPSPLQAFHYGIHRGVKCAEWIRRRRFDRVAQMVWYVDRMTARFRATGEPRFGLAALGAELALRGVFDQQHLSYDEPLPGKVLAVYEERSADQLWQEIRRLRRSQWGFLQRHLRAAALRYKIPRTIGRKLFSTPHLDELRQL